MNELSIFVDESGDFGTYESHAPFYLFTLVFHNQTDSIEDQISHPEHSLSDVGFEAKHCFHAGPIIRREEDYQYLSITERRKCLNRIMTFAKNCEISYITFSAEKKRMSDSLGLTVALSKQLSTFIREEYDFFCTFRQNKRKKPQNEAKKSMTKRGSVKSSFLRVIQFRGELV